jgi:hypothetical protein
MALIGGMLGIKAIKSNKNKIKKIIIYISGKKIRWLALDLMTLIWGMVGIKENKK